MATMQGAQDGRVRVTMENHGSQPPRWCPVVLALGHSCSFIVLPTLYEGWSV